MPFSKRENYRVWFLKRNEGPVREMTIGHPPQREEKDPRTSYLLYDLKPNRLMLEGVLFLILFFFIFSFQTFTSNVFYKTLNPT